MTQHEAEARKAAAMLDIERKAMAAARRASTPLLSTAPAYYQLPEGATQLWDVITALGLTHCHASALEYVYRAGRKSGASKADDLRKAVANLEYEIARLEARE